LRHDNLTATEQTQPEPEKGKPEQSSLRMRAAFAKKNSTGRPGALPETSRVTQTPELGQQTLAPPDGGVSTASQSTNEVVEASSANSEVATVFSDIEVSPTAQAISVEKAKPPLDETMALKAGEKPTANAPMALAANGALAATNPASSSATLKQGPMWMIAAGLLKRSLDGGRSWQPVLAGEHPLLCYATNGQELWAGGAGGALQHSVNGGATWAAILVTAKGQSLKSDVVQIEAQHSSISLTTANHEIWSSSDGGETWAKK
jgi:hypothetical protein